MADVQILRAQAGARNVNKIGWTTIAEIPASSFTAGAKYLIIAPSIAGYTGTADELHLRLVRGDGSYRSVVSGDSPLHYYYMDESSGSLTDNGSAAQNLSQVGTAQVYSQPSLVPSLPSGTSITFDNTASTFYQNTSATMPNTGNGSWTAECWARIPADDATSNLELTAWGTNSGNNYAVMRIAAGRLQFTNATQGGLYLSPTGVDYRDGEVHHYVMTYDGTTLTGYIDGQPTGTTATPTGGLDITGTTLRVGGAFTSWFNGSIDEVSHYSSALSAATVLAHYNAGAGTQFTDQYESDEVLSNKVVGSGFMAVYTQPSPAVPVLFQIGTSTYSQTTELFGVDLLAIKLDDIGTQGTDYFYNEDTTDHSLTTTPTDGASITFTPNGTDKYLYIAQATWLPNDNSIEQTFTDLLYDGGVVRRVSEEGEDASNNESRARLLMWANTPTNASHTVKVQGYMELGTSSVLASSRVIAINLSKFAQAHVAVGSDYRLAAFDTWESALSTSFTPDATQDYVVIAHGAGDFGSNQNPDTSWRLQVNKDGNGLASYPGIEVAKDTFTGSPVALPSHTPETGTWVDRWTQAATIRWYVSVSGTAQHLGDVDDVGESQTNLTGQVYDGYIEGQFVSYGDGGGYVVRSNGASSRATEAHYHLVPSPTSVVLYRMSANSITQLVSTTTGSGDWYRLYFSGHNPTILKVIRATTQAGLDDALFLTQTSTIGIIETTDSTAANQRASGEVGLWGFYDDFGNATGNTHDNLRVVKYPFAGTAPDGGAWDASDESTYTFTEILPFTSGASRAINLDLRMAETAAGTKDAILAPMVVVFSKALASGTTTYTGNFTADAHIKNTLSGTFTANANIQNTIGGTFTADAWIGSAATTYPGSFTADAIIDPANWSQWSATWSMDATSGGVGSFTADAFIQNTLSGTFTADAEILRTFSGTLTADAYVLATASGTFTADAFVLKTTAGTFTADANVLVVSSGSFTADAHIARTLAGTFTADANISTTVSGSFTADANIVNTVSGNFTADANIAATVQSAFTADANISATVESSFTADAFITKTFESSFTADANISKTTAGTFTADAFITTTTAATFTADAHISRIFGQSFTADAFIQRTLSGSFTADAAISRTYSGSFTADAVIDPAQWSLWSATWSMSVTEGAVTYPGSFTADAYVQRTFAGSFSADAFILRTFAGTFTADAEIRNTFAGTFTADAEILRTFGQTFTADAHVAATIASTFTADAYLQQTIAGAFSADANIANTVAGSFTADAEIGVTGTVNGSFTADANIAATVSGSFTADADIQQTYSGNFTADAEILVVQSGNFTADAYVQSTLAGAFSADAHIQKTVAGTFTADAEIEAATVTYSGSFTADAFIAATIASSFTADAWIAVEGTVVGQFTADAYIRNTLAGSFTADAAIRQTFGGTFTADAHVAATRSGTFTVDAHIENTLAGQFTADAYVKATSLATFTADAYVQQTYGGAFTADSHLSAVVAGSFTAQAYISNPNAVKRINSATSITGTFGARYSKTATFGSATEKAVIGTKLQTSATMDSTTTTGGTISSRTEK